MSKSLARCWEMRRDFIGSISRTLVHRTAGSPGWMRYRGSVSSLWLATATPTIHEPLPSMKKLTEAIEEHWKAALHVAIGEAIRQANARAFEKAFVGIEVITPRGSDNARLWDTSNRAINVIINNLKGIFFEDDNMGHMAFSVVGQWGEKGATIIRILDFDKSQQIRGIT